MENLLFVANGKYTSDRTLMSGVTFSIYSQLIKHYKVDALEITTSYPLRTTIEAVIEKYILKKTHSRQHSVKYSKKCCNIVNKHLKIKADYKAILVMGIHLAPYLNTDIPIVYFSDAVFSSMVGYYYKKMSKKRIKEGNLLQKLTLRKSKKAVFASEWARQNAIRDYNVLKEKTEIVHFGSNIEISNIVHKAHKDINLLFVGVDWKRKGADIAVECVKILNNIDKNNKYNLHLVGCDAPYKINLDYIHIYGFINRNVPSQRKVLDNLREISDIFILPTQAECAGIVFCESSAYGIPSITFDTGGVGDYVINGINGYRLPLNATPHDFASKIMEMVNNGNLLNKMKEESRKLYENDLNWNTFGEKLTQIIDNC